MPGIQRIKKRTTHGQRTLQHSLKHLETSCASVGSVSWVMMVMMVMMVTYKAQWFFGLATSDYPWTGRFARERLVGGGPESKTCDEEP